MGQFPPEFSRKRWTVGVWIPLLEDGCLAEALEPNKGSRAGRVAPLLACHQCAQFHHPEHGYLTYLTSCALRRARYPRTPHRGSHLSATFPPEHCKSPCPPAILELPALILSSPTAPEPTDSSEEIFRLLAFRETGVLNRGGNLG